MKAEKDTSIRKKTIRVELFAMFMEERKNTGLFTNECRL